MPRLLLLCVRVVACPSAVSCSSLCMEGASEREGEEEMKIIGVESEGERARASEQAGEEGREGEREGEREEERERQR